jgi:hypothetical protein
MRIAFCGASGTGKTTLAKWVADEFELPFNPIGSRSVAQTMGFDSPYDVDQAGKRAEFQWNLLQEKAAWEFVNEQFVSDRTTFDNLLYTALHDVYCIDDKTLAKAKEGMRRYTHIIYCPFAAFCNVDGDQDRVQDTVYHQIYDAALGGFLHNLTNHLNLLILYPKEVGERREWVRRFLEKEPHH